MAADEPEPQPQLPLAEFLREACREELARALLLLTDPEGDRDKAVHESRKSVRRVRAWLRLGDRHRRKALQPVDAQLRVLRRTIGPLRDGYSRIEALDRLRKRKDVAPLRTPLAAARQKLVDALERRWERRPRHGRSWKALLAGLTHLLDGIGDSGERSTASVASEVPMRPMALRGPVAVTRAIPCPCTMRVPE